MSPIDQNTIHVEKWTQTREGVFQSPGKVETQVIAQGDEKDPGTYVYERGVDSKDQKRIRGKDLIVDVRVDPQTGEVIGRPGIWRRFLPGPER